MSKETGRPSQGYAEGAPRTFGSPRTVSRMALLGLWRDRTTRSEDVGLVGTTRQIRQRTAQAHVAFLPTVTRQRYRTSHADHSKTLRRLATPATSPRSRVLQLFKCATCRQSNRLPAQGHPSGRPTQPGRLGEWNTSHGTAGALAQATAFHRARRSWRDISIGSTCELTGRWRSDQVALARCRKRGTNGPSDIGFRL